MKRAVYIMMLIVGIVGCGPKGLNPEVEITSPRLGEGIREGETIRVIAEARDRDGLIEEVRFYVDKEVIGVDKRQSYQNEWEAVAGEHVIKAEAIDHQGLKGSDELRIKVEAGDGRTPFAKIKVDKDEGQAPLRVKFDGSESRDPNGSSLSYRWKFGDGVEGEGEVVDHVYEEGGEYEAKLVVRDEEGLEDESSIVIKVEEGEGILLPLEVIGEKGYLEEIEIDLKEEIDSLYLRCHRCGYEDSSVNESRGTKGSVRINGGSWKELNDKTVEVLEPEASYGGIAGGYHTVRMKVEVEGSRVGRNRITFRFNGTDGISNGYRILEIRGLKGNREVLDERQFKEDDPRKWEAPLKEAKDIAKGKALWEGAVLEESPLSSKRLRATCADCHARDGRDLKYFNYSNWSIIERSRFHQLSELEGKQIASYIRSLEVPAPYQARPWNPPYQPGPGLDSRPVEEWAAGAGLEWVLEEDKDMLGHLFPEGTSEEALREVFDTRGTLNIRELPIALQLPDWNAWLPDRHPLDIWGDFFLENKSYTVYLDTLKTLNTTGISSMVNDRSLLTSIDTFRGELNKFIGIMNGPVPCWRFYGTRGQAKTPSLALDNMPARFSCEDGMSSLNLWSAVKHWEIMHTYGLEDLTDELHPYGEVRSWPGQWRQVFEVAPHRSGNDAFTFEYQTRTVGTYTNAAWYYLQVILNAGNRDPHSHFPPDWKYHFAHLVHASEYSGQQQPLRYFASLIKMYQNLDMTGPDGLGQDRGANGGAWWLWHVTPRWLYSMYPSGGYSPQLVDMLAELDTYKPGLKAQLSSALLREFVDKSSTYSASEWVRWDASVPYEQRGPQYLDPINFVPTPFDGVGPEFTTKSHASSIYRLIPRFRQEGVDEQVLQDLITWSQSVWPKGNWDTLR